jgi:hypothetical protein
LHEINDKYAAGLLTSCGFGLTPNLKVILICLIVYVQIGDRGTYHCKATNEFGTIISESVQLAFGFIGEFNLKRSPESGNQNWGKSIYCDPPQHFPG